MMAFPLAFSEAFLKVFGKVVWPELLRREKVYSEFWKLHSSDKDLTNIGIWMQEQVKDPLVRRVVEENGWRCDGIDDYDDIMLSILKWVNKNVKYVSDVESHKMDEYWQTSLETLVLRKGDCEDGSVLICVLAAAAGIPTSRFRLQFGEVVEGFGHCYVVYYGDRDGVEKVLDWCYWYVPWVVSLRVWFGDDSRYGRVWGAVRVRS